ncbi:MAG: RNA methyltransferase, partial [Gemmatimonadales bacterium]
LRADLEQRGIAVEEVSEAEFATLAATEHPQGIVAVYVPQEWSLDDLLPTPGRPLVILDAVQDPGNVGTIARTAIAFGASGLIALPGTADLENPKTVRGAMGALFRLPHLHADDVALLHWLTTHGVALWATAMDGTPILSGAPPFPVAIVLGNEGAGVRDDLLARADRRVAIPIQPVAESLNVAVAAGIILHQVTR